jgi:hypothetical protein
VQSRQLLGHEERQTFAVDVDAPLEVVRGWLRPHGVYERRDLALREPLGSDDRGPSIPHEVPSQPPQPVTRRDRLAAPRQHDQQRTPA